jgi:hypothetical protein
MAKQAGMGDNLYISGIDVSGDIGSIQRIGGGPALLDTTAINASAMERIGGQFSGELSFASYFNDGGGANRAGATGSTFLTLSALPTTDVLLTYARGTTLGNQGAGMIGKQVNYDANRGQDGALLFSVQALSNAYPLEFGRQLTAGKRQDTTATAAGSATSVDLTDVSTSFGWSAYLQVFSFTGTSCTVSIHDSANNSAFTLLSGASFTAATGVTSQRIQAATATATVRRYVSVNTAGTFTECTFAVLFVRHTTLSLQI